MTDDYRENGYTTVRLGKIFHAGERMDDPKAWDVAHYPKSTAVGRRGEGRNLTGGKVRALAPPDWEIWVDGGHNAAAGEALARVAQDWAVDGRMFSPFCIRRPRCVADGRQSALPVDDRQPRP